MLQNRKSQPPALSNADKRPQIISGEIFSSRWTIDVGARAPVRVGKSHEFILTNFNSEIGSETTEFYLSEFEFLQRIDCSF